MEYTGLHGIQDYMEYRTTWNTGLHGKQSNTCNTGLHGMEDYIG